MGVDGSISYRFVENAPFVSGTCNISQLCVLTVDVYRVPDDWAQRGMASWREISFRCGLDKHINGRL